MRILDVVFLAGAALWNSEFASSFDLSNVTKVDENINNNTRLDCYREQECKDLRTRECKAGYTKVGLPRDGCKWLDFVNPICGSTITSNRFGVDADGNKKKCMWRGNGPNCNGAGAPGEVVLFKSGNGGGSTEVGGLDGTQCSTGYKYFTCPLPEWKTFTSMFRWNDCQDYCDANETEVAYANDMYGMCPHQPVKRGLRCCCKNAGKPLSNCHRVDPGHCDDNTCNPSEVTAARKVAGDSFSYQYDREKSLCCIPEMEALKPVEPPTEPTPNHLGQSGKQIRKTCILSAGVIWAWMWLFL